MKSEGNAEKTHKKTPSTCVNMLSVVKPLHIFMARNRVSIVFCTFTRFFRGEASKFVSNIYALTNLTPRTTTHHSHKKRKDSLEIRAVFS